MINTDASKGTRYSAGKPSYMWMPALGFQSVMDNYEETYAVKRRVRTRGRWPS